MSLIVCLEAVSLWDGLFWRRAALLFEVVVVTFGLVVLVTVLVWLELLIRLGWMLLGWTWISEVSNIESGMLSADWLVWMCLVVVCLLDVCCVGRAVLLCLVL